MRLIAIGQPLPHVDIDNYNPLTAPSLFDYDAVYFEPASMTRFAAELLGEDANFTAYDGRPVVNAATTASAVGAAELLKRRFDETQRFLEQGGVVVVAGRPNAVQGGIVGFEGCDRYGWLPAPAGMAWGPPYVRAAEGKTIRIVAEEHPFASFLRDFRRDLAYRAIFDDRQQPVRQHGRVIARGGSGAPIAVEFAVLAGRVIFLPAIADDLNARGAIAERLMDGVRQVLREAVPMETPYWTRNLAVPGLAEAEAELQEAEAAAEEADARLAVSQEKADELAGHRRLVTDDGRTLTGAVRDALVLLGFGVLDSAEGDGAGLVVESEGTVAFVECEGSREEVVEWPYVRLQRRLEQRLLTLGDAPKGIVIANGWRATAPEDRKKPQFTEAVRLACENYRYALVTGCTLLTMTSEALGGASEGELLAFRRRLLAKAGELTVEQAMGAADDEAEAGSIF